MYDEPVQAEVIESYDEHLDEPRRRGLGVGPIIAIVVAVLLLSVIGFYFLYDPGVESIEIINPRELDDDSDGNFDSVQFDIMATSVGPWRIDGVGKLEISIGGDITYTGEEDIKGDRAVVEVPFNKFVTINGNYALRFSMDGKSNTNHFRVVFVPEEIIMDVAEEYEASSNAWIHYASVSPLFRDGAPTEIANFNKMYDIRIDINGPEDYSSSETNSMWSMDLSKTKQSYLVRKMIESDYMGYHHISIVFINKLVKEGSKNREVTNETIQTYLNRPPSITDVRYPSTIRTNEVVTFTVMASDPDENDKPAAVTVFWDSDNPDSEESSTVNMTGSTVNINHMFETSGDYVLYFTVADSGEVFSAEENYRKFNESIVEIYVRTGILG